MSSTDLTPYVNHFRNLGFMVPSNPDKDRFVCSTEQEDLFGVPIFTGNRFGFSKRGQKFVLSHVCGHPTGDYLELEFDTFKEVEAFVLLLNPNPPLLDETHS